MRGSRRHGHTQRQPCQTRSRSRHFLAAGGTGLAVGAAWALAGVRGGSGRDALAGKFGDLGAGGTLRYLEVPSGAPATNLSCSALSMVWREPRPGSDAHPPTARIRHQMMVARSIVRPTSGIRDATDGHSAGCAGVLGQSFSCSRLPYHLINACGMDCVRAAAWKADTQRKVERLATGELISRRFVMAEPEAGVATGPRATPAAQDRPKLQ